MVFSLYQYKVSDRDFNLGIAMPENYARTAMPGLENTQENLVRAARSAEFTPVDRLGVGAGLTNQFVEPRNLSLNPPRSGFNQPIRGTTKSLVKTAPERVIP
ncbi:MAG TPA: hypothetical protein DDW76_05240, partial [Cyanobacteria bacterium UBA11369]|nr:hypothetical protein [Cyanobacteria bacterium UBA11369]